MIPISCCWDSECPQHKQMREIHNEEEYPILLEERRQRGWFRRRIEELETPRVGGRA